MKYAREVGGSALKCTICFLKIGLTVQKLFYTKARTLTHAHTNKRGVVIA
jgi:hypothetical protein